MAPSTGGNGDKPIGTFGHRFLGKFIVNNVVQHYSTIGMYGFIDELFGTEGRDHYGHLPLYAHLNIVLEAIIGGMHNLIHCKWRRGCIRIFRIILRQLSGNLFQPAIQLFRGTRIQRRELTYNTSLTLGNHQIGV